MKFILNEVRNLDDDRKETNGSFIYLKLKKIRKIYLSCK
jgi:hypothetical protein